MNTNNTAAYSVYNMAGKKKKMVYVGGLDAAVNEEILHAAFIPFGDIREVNIPKDFAENFEEEDDAAAAIENMHGAELFGKVLKCNMAKPMTKLQPGQAVWTAEEWLSNSLKNSEGEVEPFQE